MKVTMNPLALSFLLSDLSVGPDDVEGLLLGKMTRITSTTIEDHDADQVQDCVQINITGHFTSQIGSTTDLDDDVIVRGSNPSGVQFTLNPALRDDSLQESLVGWFRYSSRPSFIPNVPSVHDHRRDEVLRHLLPHSALDLVHSGPLDQAPFVFLKLSASFNDRCPTGLQGFERSLFRLKRVEENEASVETIQLDIPNLGHTDASKRYLQPMPSGATPKASQFEKNTAVKQHVFLHDLGRYSLQRVKHCQGIIDSLAEEYKATEATLIGEIFALEEKLKNQPQADNHDNSFDTMSVEIGTGDFLLNDSDAGGGEASGSGANIIAANGDTDPEKRPESRSVCHSIFGRDDLDDLTQTKAGDDFLPADDEDDIPSPSIQETPDSQTTQILAETMLYDSEDVVPATQYHDDSDAIRGNTTTTSSKTGSTRWETRTDDMKKEKEGVVGRARGRKAGDRGDNREGLQETATGKGEDEEEDENRAKRRKVSRVRNGAGEWTVMTELENAGAGSSSGDATVSKGKGKSKGKSKGNNQKVASVVERLLNDSDEDSSDGHISPSL